MPKLEAVFGGTVLHKYARAKEWDTLVSSCSYSSDARLLRTLNEHQRTPLHYCVEGGAPEDILLEMIRIAPFQVRVRDLSGETPLHLGCQFGVPLLVVYAMLEADATTAKGSPSVLTLRNHDGMTPLQILQLQQKTAQSINQTVSLAKAKHAVASRWFFSQIGRAVDNEVPPPTESNDLSQLKAGMNWHFHCDQAENVLTVLEEAARGEVGYVGQAY